MPLAVQSRPSPLTAPTAPALSPTPRITASIESAPASVRGSASTRASTKSWRTEGSFRIAPATATMTTTIGKTDSST